MKHVQDERCGQCARRLRIARNACGRLCRRIRAHLDAPFGVQFPGMVAGYPLAFTSSRSSPGVEQQQRKEVLH